MSVEFSLRSTARTTPSATLSPTADEPSWVNDFSYFDGLNGVFDLENAAFRGESVDAPIVVGLGVEHA